MIRIGTNTMTVVAADTRIAPHTWMVPRYAASPTGTPCCRSRNMFSRTTIAASTTMPTANARPASEITLIERPSAAMATNEPMMETGIASEITRVARPERRKRNSSSAASAPPMRMFWRTSRMAEVM